MRVGVRMKQVRPKDGQPADFLRQVAMQYPEAEEGLACAGTALEKRTIKVRKKAFLFLGTTNAMVKLGDSLTRAAELTTVEPNRFTVGAHGWVTITFGDAESLPFDLLVEWIDESYRLLAPKQLTASLAERVTTGGLTEARKTEARKRNAKLTAGRGKSGGRSS